MDTLLPLYPRIDNEATSFQRETRLDPPPPIRADPQVPPGPSSPAGCSASTSGDGWETASKPPYSPTKTELESHPIRQRLSIQGDEVSTGFRAALEFESLKRPAREEESFERFERFEPAQEGIRKSLSNMADTSIKEGDAVSYQWNGDKKGGTVQEVATEGSVQMTTARGNTAEKQAKPDDPAIRMERAGHDVVKNVSEVTKEEAGETHNEGGVQKEVKGNEAKTGEKRGAEPKENGEEPKKKKGRPAGKGAAGGAAKGAQKKRPAKRAATESGEPRRSGRVAKKS